MLRLPFKEKKPRRALNINNGRFNIFYKKP